jgi:hypothetical protein
MANGVWLMAEEESGKKKKNKYNKYFHFGLCFNLVFI